MCIYVALHRKPESMIPDLTDTRQSDDKMCVHDDDDQVENAIFQEVTFQPQDTFILRTHSFITI